MIEIKQVTRRYGSKVAVNAVDLSIDRGEVVGLLGHNGAGKTTLMKMLTGYLDPTEGDVVVGGVSVSADRIGVQKQIGYLPEHAPIYDEMLVQEYLTMMAELRGVPKASIASAVGRCAMATGLEAHLISPISHLSKGFRQRVGIAQALLHDPDVLVLDEPTNGLDPVQIESIRTLIRGLAAHTTILLSTHILQEVEAVCDRVVVLIDGSVEADAPLTELLASHAVQVSLSGDLENVPQVLGALGDVSSVHDSGEDPHTPGHRLWRVTGVEQSPSIPNLLTAILDAGWTPGSIAPRVETLEGVFRRLQREHVARVEAA